MSLVVAEGTDENPYDFSPQDDEGAEYCCHMDSDGEWHDLFGVADAEQLACYGKVAAAADWQVFSESLEYAHYECL